VDVIALMDALKIPTAVLAGYDWGGRAACVAAALWPERCSGLVSVNDYLIQDIAHAGTPLPAKFEWGIWTQFYFATERGRAGLAANRNDIARLCGPMNHLLGTSTTPPSSEAQLHSTIPTVSTW
jgi:pimeloyl-ACP methyl ester carboxylesterase